MIKGFHVHVSGEELKTHLLKRVAHHNEKAEWYERNKDKVNDAIENDHHSNDPVKNMKEAGVRHRSRATLFKFYAEHLLLNEQYELSTHELVELELIAQNARY